MRKADFENLQAVLAKEKPSRPTLFEFFMNKPLYAILSENKGKNDDEERSLAFKNAGYDYVMMFAPFYFPRKEIAHEKTISLNDGVLISDRKSLEAYAWPDVDKADYGPLAAFGKKLPEGMKMIVCGPGGVLENVIALIGYDNMCFMLADDPQLFSDMCAAVGSRLLRHYEIASKIPGVGALVSNDDWGFKTQLMMSPEDMRKYVFPWHRKIVEAGHKAGKPVILHSCGNLSSVMEDIIEDMRYDAKHSYEDIIMPVEDAYEELKGRIAVLGGIDLDFLCRSKPEAVRQRSAAMLSRASGRGGYALGSGNSIPEYVPRENYLAMISAATAP
ncbi:MAG: hypothetical protein A2X49_02910 [Lentisphaerae bacterium GWF2_52_8]|nr:MAG: hypothetical protein A2X49_02910 [Lentisphaerae bacterium GWF2_52_8]